MKTKHVKVKCTEPGCNAEYNDNAHLGIHKRTAHGIVGSSVNSKKKREQRAAAKAAAAAADQPAKRTYTKRSNALATLETSTNHQGQANGQANGLTPRRFHAEAALAVAYGRFQELCKGIAFEYDLPPRSFAARFAELIHAETLR